VLTKWADQLREVDLLSFQGEVVAFATHWVGSLRAVRLGAFEHLGTDGRTKNLIITSQFGEIFLGEDDDFIALRLQKPFDISPSPSGIIFDVKKSHSFRGEFPALSHLVHSKTAKNRKDCSHFSAFRFLYSIVALLNGLSVFLRVFVNGSPKDCACPFVSANHFVNDAISAVHVFGEWRAREGGWQATYVHNEVIRKLFGKHCTRCCPRLDRTNRKSLPASLDLCLSSRLQWNDKLPIPLRTTTRNTSPDPVKRSANALAATRDSVEPNGKSPVPGSSPTLASGLGCGWLLESQQNFSR
jgi:hypothetical protein